MDHPVNSRRGAALLLVLAGLALLTIMVVALFVSLSSELQTSKLYATGSSVKLLSQTAVNLVTGEIYQATSDPTLCWASQPGMIRTYKNDGTANGYFKLYSDSGMVGTGAFDHTVSANLVPDGNAGTTPWYNQKGVYVDLNQPLTVAGKNQYPILDGDVSSTDLVQNFTYPSGPGGATSLPQLMTPAPTGTVTVLGPTLSTTQPQVAGFWVNSNAPIDATSPNQAPMPVRWLYVLKNGEILYPDSDTGGTTVKFTASSTATGVTPSLTDPIVGRIAFWTDDETGKVNINTASEGAYNNPTTYATSFNDTPRVCTPYDLNLENCPAFQHEYQRYPGHPSTVSLSTVFGNFTTATSYPENIYSLSSSTNIAPRTIGGGSTEATVPYVVASASNPALSWLSNRLYATPDELLLQPNRSLTASTIDQPALKRAQFFITASSRAPDVNLFNLPRVSVWPIASAYFTNTSTALVTAFDRTIAFCTTIAGQPYYFQRSSWKSQSELESATPTSDPAYVKRNWALLTYLKYFCSHAIPGYGGTFSAKYATTLSTTGFPSGTVPTSPGTELDQILTEIFDYVRSTNIYDSSLTSGNQFNPTTAATGTGEVVPTFNANNGAKGFGRYPTLSKAGILLIATGDATTASHGQIIGGTIATPTYNNAPAITGSNVRVQAALMFQLFDPSQGYPAITNDCQVKIVNSTMTWKVNGTSSSMFPNWAAGSLNTTSGNSQEVCWGGNLGTMPFQGGYSNASGAFFSLTADSPAGSSITFSGTVEVQLLTSTANGATKIQDITFNFPSASVNTPTYIPPSPTWTSSGVTFEQLPSNFLSVGTSGCFIGRFAFNSNHTVPSSNPFMGYLLVGKGDIMQSVQSGSGDLRLVAANAVIPSTLIFGGHQLYGQYAQPMAHSFGEGYGVPFYGATRGQLASNVTTYWSSAATSCPLSTPFNVTTPPSPPVGSGSNDLAYMDAKPATYPYQTCEPEGFGTTTTGTIAGVTAGTTASWASDQPLGDFDNGTGSVRDGPYINKADEGGLAVGAYLPYYMDTGQSYTSVGTEYFSPARQMPSPVMLGSLPTGVFDNRPWQTLLFHPEHAGVDLGTPLHVGNPGRSGTGALLSGAPGDYLLLDLFTMPVVEPYAISKPLSTAGRINMNYLIVPFTYINRDTGLRAVLESQQMLSVPNTDSGSISSNNNTYKQMTNSSHAPTYSNAPATLRFSINLDETLKGFAKRFYPQAFGLSTSIAPDIFHSPSEICTLDLIPNDTSDSNAKFGPLSSATPYMQTYWNNHQLTGDNSRERPYANIYPLLTTKSNTYTVHFRVQALQPAPGAGSDPTIWREGTDVVTSEYRGSQTIERYVDPNATLPDYASYADPTTATPLSSFYRFRVVSTKQFNP